jgi:hypothetical protein
MDYQFNNQKPPTGLNPNSHNRLVVGSNLVLILDSIRN